jgi:arsenate reductase-like glutaredoxin family protein
MAEKRKRSRKPKVVGTMVVDGKEIPIVEWPETKEALKQWEQERRKRARELERERREVEKALNKVEGSLLEELLKMRDAMRWWWRDEGK